MRKPMSLLFVGLFIVSVIAPIRTNTATTYTEKWYSFSTANGGIYNIYVVSDEPLSQVYGRPLLQSNDASHIQRIYVEDQNGNPVEDLSTVQKYIFAAQSSARFLKDVSTQMISNAVPSADEYAVGVRTDRDTGENYFVYVCSQVADWYRNGMLLLLDGHNRRVDDWKELILKIAVQEELYKDLENTPEYIETLKAIVDNAGLPFDIKDLLETGYTITFHVKLETVDKIFMKDIVNTLKKVDKELPFSTKSLTKHFNQLADIAGVVSEGFDITNQALRLMYLGTIANAAAEDRLATIGWFSDLLKTKSWTTDAAIAEGYQLAAKDFEDLYKGVYNSFLNCVLEVLKNPATLLDIGLLAASIAVGAATAPLTFSWMIAKWMIDSERLVELSSLAASLRHFIELYLDDEQITLPSQDPKPYEETYHVLELFQINYYAGFSFYYDWLTAVDCPLTTIREWLDASARQVLWDFNYQKKLDQTDAEQLWPSTCISSWTRMHWSDWEWLAQKAGLPYSFHIDVSSSHTYYKPGETVAMSVLVTNLRQTESSYVLGVSLQDPLGQSKKYDSQMTINPQSATLSPGGTLTHTIWWTIPSDAPLGNYKVTANCWKDNTYTAKYDDDMDVWAPIFDVYRLLVLVPKSDKPAIGGTPDSPIPVQVEISLPVSFLPDNAFSISVGGKQATFTRAECPAVQTNSNPNIPVYADSLGLYALNVQLPTQASEGSYDLSVSVGHDGVSDSATEKNTIVYANAPSSEPMQKGLAWLRITQYSDGSWRSNVGVTALCALAFLNSGYDETDSAVQNAILYLLSKSHADGTICSDYNWETYETSLALIALTATHNSAYQNTIGAARNWLVNSLWDESCIWGSVTKDNWYYGGFGYGEETRPDLSNTQFALLALDAAGLPKDDSTWSKVQVFLHRCQKVDFPITLNIEGSAYTVQPLNYAGTSGGYDSGFIYSPLYPGSNPYTGNGASMGSMTGAGIWGLLLSGVPKSDESVVEAMNWVTNHYTWNENPNTAGYRRYYYYLSMAKALTMYGQKTIGGHDWYQELYDKITSPSEMITVGTDKAYWSPSGEDFTPELSTAYAILSLQTRAVTPPVQRLSYLTFVLRSNCLIRIIDPEGNLVGYNYAAGSGENSIPTAIYSGPYSEPQYIVIVNPKPGTYKLELVGISEGPYALTIQGNYGEEVTKSFEYTGEIGPAELQGSQVMVTAIVGPMDVYANPPEFEKVIDDFPPTSQLVIDVPNYVSGTTTYVTPDTPFILTAADVGSGIYATAYQISNATYNTGWIVYVSPFKLVLLADGVYTIGYNSTDNAGNVETTNTVNVTLFSWNYVFEDSYGRGTTLKINTAHKLFQFTTPDKDYSIREATYMRMYEHARYFSYFTKTVLYGRKIVIEHFDGELRLFATAVDTDLDFCELNAWGLKTGDRYYLLDKPGT
jgi:squalene-hopene/tetraprenyl-beta-curcumene cyclase